MRRSLPAYALAVATTALAAAFPLCAQEPTGISPYVQGLAALEAEDYDQAVSLLAQVVQQEPNNEPAWFSLGVARFKQKTPDLPGALEAFRQALRLAPNRPGTRLYIGRIYETQGAFAEAISVFTEEVIRASGAAKTEALVALGRANYKAERYAAAREALQEAVEADAKYVEGLYWLGLAQTALKDYTAAIKSFRDAKQVLQDYSDLRAALSRMRPEQQRERKLTEEKLAQEYGRAQDFAQNLLLWPSLNKALGDAYLGDRQFDMARNAYRAALDKAQQGSTTDADVYVRLARAYLADAKVLFNEQSLLYTMIGVMRSAEQAVDKALELDPKSGPAYAVKGEIYAFEAATYNTDPKQNITSHTYEEALDAFAKALQAQPDNVDALIERANTYLKQAQQELPGSAKAKEALAAARGDVQQALTLRPEIARAYVILSQVALAEEKYDEAQQFAEKGIALDPKDPRAYDAAGLVMYYTGRLAEAARYFRRGLEIQDRDAPLHFNLANTFYQMQSWYMALREYKKALDNTPTATLARTAYQRAYILYRMALAYHETQRYDAEIETLNDALALDASYFDAYLQLARAYAAQKQYAGAQRALEQAQGRAATDQDSSLAYTLSGQIYETAGDPHAAALAYSSALAKDPENPLAKAALARLSG